MSVSLSVCVCVCLFTSISLELLDRSSQNFVYKSRGSVLFWWRHDMLCTSSFMDDVTFGRMEQQCRDIKAESDV